MVIGIDEVGRGPIAGPVCVAAFCIRRPAALRSGITKAMQDHGLPLRDSKKLSAKHRVAWTLLVAEWRKKGWCDFAVTVVSAKKIDSTGIAPAIRHALRISIKKLSPKTTDIILLDGGLKAPAHFKRQKTIIKGDEKESAIAFASIVAKVHRDNIMYREAKHYPAYGFDAHVGYGTKAHYTAIKKYGLTPLHRKTFLGRILAL